jgi:hypothetical protein
MDTPDGRGGMICHLLCARVCVLVLRLKLLATPCCSALLARCPADGSRLERHAPPTGNQVQATDRRDNPNPIKSLTHKHTPKKRPDEEAREARADLFRKGRRRGRGGGDTHSSFLVTTPTTRANGSIKQQQRWRKRREPRGRRSFSFCGLVLCGAAAADPSNPSNQNPD